eukprot:CAMPEP_0171935042 /NCGR_PEP_ID=MMETSP0993-20121228/32538_1 /TAXON_ID=483369 /ORGANISM="non described non described, Strain CCMP2098" /LENGTH=409 /DNA_ID=CAMNT_0012575875 /DNA_START=65 /DNA_END=1295 /DNA_ORIENTATION=-
MARKTPISLTLQVRNLAAVSLKRTKKKATPSVSKGWFVVGGSMFGIGAFTWAVTGDNELSAPIRESYAWKWICAQAGEISKPFSEPNREKLLPDWPYIPNTPPGTPCPPTLVIDLEGTLCASTWDRKYGWRHAKRPGVENFLKDLGRYYELVIFTSNIGGIADPIIQALDKDGVVYFRLYREATKFHNGAHVKDLSALNRDLRKVLIIDDDPAAYQLQPGNAIHIKPFKDAHDKGDSALEDLLPFLRAIVNEEVQDYPALLERFPSNEASDISSAYNSKLSSVEEHRDRAKSTGLGGMLRSISEAAPQQQVSDNAFVVERRAGATIANLAKAPEVPKSNLAPLAAEHKGGLWKRLDALKKDAEEDNRKKMEAFNDVVMRKEKEAKNDEMNTQKASYISNRKKMESGGIE